MGYSAGASGGSIVRVLSLASILILVCSASRGQAQQIDLAWRAPASCPAAAHVRDRIAALLTSARSERYALRVDARVQRAGKQGSYRIALRVVSTQHHAARVLEASDCAELAETAAWLVALTVDPELRPTEPAPEPAPDTIEPAAPSTATGDRAASQAEAPAQTAQRASRATANEAPKSPSAPPQSSSSPHEAAKAELTDRAPGPPWPRSFRLGANVGMVSGQGPGLQVGLGAFAGYSVGAFYTQARFLGSVPREVRIAGPAQVHVWALGAELAECALFGAALRVGPCIDVMILRSAADLTGLSAGRDRAYWWGVGGGGLALFWRVWKQLEFSLAGAAHLPLSRRPRFVVQGFGPVVTAAAWSADIRVGLGIVLP